jgi:hypothetical protein
MQPMQRTPMRPLQGLVYALGSAGHYDATLFAQAATYLEQNIPQAGPLTGSGLNFFKPRFCLFDFKG